MKQQLEQLVAQLSELRDSANKRGRALKDIAYMRNFHEGRAMAYSNSIHLLRTVINETNRVQGRRP